MAKLLRSHKPIWNKDINPFILYYEISLGKFQWRAENSILKRIFYCQDEEQTPFQNRRIHHNSIHNIDAIRFETISIW